MYTWDSGERNGREANEIYYVIQINGNLRDYNISRANYT